MNGVCLSLITNVAFMTTNPDACKTRSRYEQVGFRTEFSSSNHDLHVDLARLRPQISTEAMTSTDCVPNGPDNAHILFRKTNEQLEFDQCETANLVRLSQGATDSVILTTRASCITEKTGSDDLKSLQKSLQPSELGFAVFPGDRWANSLAITEFVSAVLHYPYYEPDTKENDFAIVYFQPPVKFKENEVELVGKAACIEEKYANWIQLLLEDERVNGDFKNVNWLATFDSPRQ